MGWLNVECQFNCSERGDVVPKFLLLAALYHVATAVIFTIVLSLCLYGSSFKKSWMSLMAEKHQKAPENHQKPPKSTKKHGPRASLEISPFSSVSTPLKAFSYSSIFPSTKKPSWANRANSWHDWHQQKHLVSETCS